MQPRNQRVPLPGLTALRFFAAFYVLAFHFLANAETAPDHVAWPQRLLSAGFTGVSCFFILSGFILAYTHEHVPRPARFWRARWARIYPLYVFALLWAILPMLHQPHMPERALLVRAVPADLLLIQDWFPSLALRLNGPAWTLSCEAFFYLLFPFAVALLVRARAFIVPLLLAFTLYQLLPPIVVNYWLPTHAPGWVGAGHAFLFLPISRLGEFCTGIVLGLAFLKQTRANGGTAPDSPRWLMPAGLALSLALLLLNRLIPHEIVRNGLLMLPYSMLIWACAASRSRVLASAPLQLLGEISYGVYLLQMPFSHTLFLNLERLNIVGAPSRICMLLIFPTAWITYVLIEKPGRALLLGQSLTRPGKPIPTPQPELP